MDIIGDYAGDELFLLEGDSLLSGILDDPLLAVGKEDDVSFQYLHARYSFERTLKEYVKRNAVFEVAFFEDLRHMSYHTGSSDFVLASRCLTRTYLKAAVKELRIPLHTFQNLNDPDWLRFAMDRKPMFIMTDDGGSAQAGERLQAETALNQRLFVYEILTSGIAVALMRGAVFKDTKIFSFIYEQRRMSNNRSIIDPRIWRARGCAVVCLNAKLPPLLSNIRTTSENRTEWLLNAARAVLAGVDPGDSLARPFLYIFLAHGVILDTLPVSVRAQRLPTFSSEVEGYLRNKFLPSLFISLERSFPDMPTFRDVDLDGRVFFHLLKAIPPQSLTTEVMSDLIGLEHTSKLAEMGNALGMDNAVFSYPLLGPRGLVGLLPSHTDQNDFRVLPFSHPVLDEYLSQVQINAAPSSFPPESGRFDLDSGLGKVFKDNMHWHRPGRPILPKHLGGEDGKIQTLDSKARARVLRADQRFQAGLKLQAQSLTGALGKRLEPITIPLHGKATDIATTKPRPVHAAASKKVTSREETRRQVQTKRQTKKQASDLEWWSGKGTNEGELWKLSRLPSLHSRIQKTDLLLRNRTRMAENWLVGEVQLYRLDLELRAWIDHPTRDSVSTQDRYRVSVLRMIKDQSTRATPTVIRVLSSVLSALGFPTVTASLLGAGNLPDHDLTFEFIKVLKKSGSSVYPFMKITEPPMHWLLRCFGEYMDRSLDSAPDPRVQFDPDRWQREVLDNLDEEASVLVVAPTSAGKTFISYYAMERVLRSSDDGVLVYVAPTKALVTQIAAEVSVRFQKGQRSCWAIHTRDYRIHDPQKCQILITVPEILAIMLLSPTLARVWTPRLKRIILDEIHSIGQEVGGAIWEQLLLLAPCPVIGLSATVGNPEKFNTWLSSVQAAHHFKHRFIYHEHRYSHLRKYFYLRSAAQAPFTGLRQHKPTGRLRFLHPVSMLSSAIGGALPPDFTLEARDCLTLFQALRKLGDTAGITEDDLGKLDPTKFFDPPTFLKQQHILRYEQTLIRVISKLREMPASHETLQEIVHQLTDDEIYKAPDDLLSIAPEITELEGSLPHLVSDLYAEGDLPALVFSFNRHQCETHAQKIHSFLEEAEEIWRTTSPEWQSKLQAWEVYKSKAKDRERIKERIQRQRKDEDDGVQQDTAWESSFDPSAPSPEFSFAGIKTSYDKTSLESDLRDLRWTSTPDWAIAAIRRGIAVHHSGMNRKYRNLVETGTLALGINAPCKTVVFSGDTTYLTALQYRQAAGRAGRRGFDLLGKVVFHGITLDRVQRLVLSRLPPISGQFPLSTTLCLRLFNLLAGSQNAEYAVTAVSTILSLPQISIGSEIGRLELLHHLRFSIDYLLRAQLLSSDGQPLNLAGIVTHLYYQEPNNLAFVALLRSGVIHRICDQSQGKAARDLMLVLCYMFGRRLLPRSAVNEENLRPLVKRYPSMIVLPPLPKAVEYMLNKHDSLILRVFTGYAWTYASQNATNLGSDDQLPLSGIQVPVTSSLMDWEFGRILRSTALTTFICSKFVSNSGHTDSFGSIEELCRNARQGIHMNGHPIPSMNNIFADNESAFKLNAYLLDFYTHGQVESLVLANGIRRGDVWYFLQDFLFTLLTIKTSLQELLRTAATQQACAQDETQDSGVLEIEEVDLDDGDSVHDDGFTRPRGVDNADWKVYEVFSSVATDFEAKFRKMWA
ncbi:hypothetical protein JB92DRAFT_2966409 [Gautieria morchelliformis]|nr:hypothetical protein JB92DRAFT_2966409 [Gautieria morchelliformis]